VNRKSSRIDRPRRRGPLLAIALVSLLALGWLAWKLRPGDPPEAPAPLPERERATPPSTDRWTPELRRAARRSARLNGFPVPDEPVPIDPEVAPFAERLERSSASAGEDLEIVDELIAAFRGEFERNPVGDNSEITRVLRGLNPEGLQFLPFDAGASEVIDAEGRLLDRWGTPYHFHPVDQWTLEIRSAGPDGELFTDDDAVLAPR